MKRTLKHLSTLLLALASLPALAHPGHAELTGDLMASFGAGLLHPLTGIDHLLAMLAAGIWSARARQRAYVGVPHRSRPGELLLPLVFLVTMALGAAGGMAGLRLPLLEGGIALTVALTGMLVAASVRLPAWGAGLVMGGFALWHGNAHGLELPQAASGLGFLIASAALLLSGRMLARLPLARPLGGAIAAAGVALLAF